MKYTPPCNPHTCECHGKREAVVRPDEFERWLVSPLGATIEEWYAALPVVFDTHACTCDGRHHHYCPYHWASQPKYINTGDPSGLGGTCVQMWPEHQGNSVLYLVPL